MATELLDIFIVAIRCDREGLWEMVAHPSLCGPSPQPSPHRGEGERGTARRPPMCVSQHHRQSIWMFAAFTTLFHLAISFFSICPNSSGVVGMASAPASYRRCLASAWPMTLAMSALILATMSLGVPAGAT